MAYVVIPLFFDSLEISLQVKAWIQSQSQGIFPYNDDSITTLRPFLYFLMPYEEHKLIVQCLFLILRKFCETSKSLRLAQGNFFNWVLQRLKWPCHIFFFFKFLYIFFAGYSVLATPSFAYVAHFEFFRNVWIRTQRAAVTSRRATNLATHLHQRSHPPIPRTYPSISTNLATHFQNFATHLHQLSHCIVPVELFYIERGCNSERRYEKER